MQCNAPEGHVDHHRVHDHAKVQSQQEEANQLSLAPQAPHACEHDVDIE